MNSLKATKSPFVISDTIDDMVIVINVNSGAYYSLTSAGGELWSKIEKTTDQFSQQEINSIKTLVTEGLVTVEEDFEATEVVNFADLGTRYMDMEGMLMGDPIHEVDAQGWPALRDKES